MKRLLLTFAITLGLVGSLIACSPPAPVAADAASEICKGVNMSESGTCSSSTTSIDRLVTTIVNILSWLVGVTAVIMIIVGGFKYVTSGGDSGHITSAKNTIIYAIIGLVIVAFAQIIVRFVVSRLPA